MPARLVTPDTPSYQRIKVSKQVLAAEAYSAVRGAAPETVLYASKSTPVASRPAPAAATGVAARYVQVGSFAVAGNAEGAKVV